MDVSQISMPMRILLIGAVVFLAAWFTILKPGGGDETISPVTPADAATTTTAAATATPAAGDTATENTPVAATAIPTEVLAKLPKDVAAALKAGKTLVLGVFAERASNWRPMSDDDRYVRNALEKTNRYDGEVFAKIIGIEDLSTYGTLVNDLGVTQSPAVVVIDRNLKGTALTGYVDRIAINQAIADARRDSIYPAITDEFLRKANKVCMRFEVREARWSLPTIPGRKARAAATDRLNRINRDLLAAVHNLQAPAKYKGFTSAWEKSISYHIDMNQRTSTLLKTKGVKAAQKHVASYDASVARKVERSFDDLGLTACVGNRRS